MEGLVLEVVVSRRDRDVVHKWLAENLPYTPVVYRSGKVGAVKIIANKQIKPLLNSLRKLLAERGIALSIWDGE